jgi:trehalose utilization protein
MSVGADDSIMTRLCSILTLVCVALSAAGKTVRVVVWDEQQPAQKQAYTNFLGNQIAAHLKTIPGLAVKSVSLNDPEKGVSDDVLDNCDVLIWWGHQKHGEISSEKAKQIVQRIKDGRLSLIALHSAHWSEPFVEAMRERTRLDARKSLGGGVSMQFIAPPRFEAPKADSPLTPRTEWTNSLDRAKVALITLPRCVFPAWRNDGAPSHVTTVRLKHPIAEGVPAKFDIPHTEMYSEPFHVPPPDEVIFEEKWDKGEHFRSGCVWKVGKGKVFYFRPGHETYPIYTQPIPLKIIGNAVEWLGGK